MMQVYHTLSSLPRFNKAVITIGTFDGVHLGHKQIILQLLKEADAIGGTPVLLTFWPHPKQVVDSNRKPIFMLNSPEEKYSLLHKAGIDHIVVAPFSREFAEQPAEQYIKNLLVDTLQAHTIIIGYDHRFGKNREGDYHLLDSLSSKYGYQVREIPERLIRNMIISSTRIREALLTGDLSTAHDFLGYRYFFSGLVIAGNKLGRTIGYPTANLKIEDPEKLVPANGVYAVEVESSRYPGIFKGMMNIGTRPTVDGTRRTIEVHLLDFDGDLYDTRLQITLHKWLRKEEKFEGLIALKAQLEKDQLNTREAFL